MTAALGCPRCHCGRGGTGRAGKTTNALCDWDGSPRPVKGQGGQGQAVSCCTLQEGNQGLGAIELRELSRLRTLFNYLAMYILQIYNQ